MAVPYVIYKFEVYNNANYLGTVKWKAPARGLHSGERWDVANGANLTTGSVAVFGDIMSTLYVNPGMPPVGYLQKTLTDGLTYPLTGFDFTSYATAGNIVQFFIDKAANFGLEYRLSTSNPSNYGEVRYMRGTWYSDWYSCGRFKSSYTTGSGGYQGNLWNEGFLPLPDFERLQSPSVGANDTLTMCYPYIEGMCFYPTGATPPECQAKNGTVTCYGQRAMKKSQALTWLGDYEPVTPDPNDPYDEIDSSTPSGPAAGEGIPATDEIDIPSLPSVSVTDTGFVTLFNPTLAQVKDLADYMWAGLFDINTFRKIFADPMDCILGFNLLPVAIPDGGTGTVTVGNISTGISMTKASGQWVEVDCGSIAVPEPYGSYLDWAPYVKVSLYLPYIGTVELSTDDVMGRELTLKYHVDVLSCSCVAYLKCGPDVLYQFTGSCGYSIPVTSENFRQMISSIVTMTATLGGAIAGGITAPAAIAAGASTAQNVMNSKPEVHRSGAIGSSAGIMGIQKPFLIMEIPKACKPSKQYHYLGYPSFVTVQLSGLSGYTEFDSIILSGISCTETERRMIEDICKGGIYL